MERLTQWFDKKVAGIAASLEEKYTAEELIDILANRLAAYEDTGLTPEEVKLIANALREVGETYNCWFNYVAQCVIEHSKLQEFVQAEKAGRLVVLPCKVGDILYEVDLPEYGVITCKAVSISYYNGPMFHVPGNEAVKSLTVEVEVIEGHGKGSSYNFEIDEFGKTIFLTRQQAEEALGKEDENA